MHPAPIVALMRLLPTWRKLAIVGHTLPHDFAVIGDLQSGRPLPEDRWNTLNIPALVITGGKGWAWMAHGALAFADLIGAERGVLPKQTHNVKPAVLADAVTRFLGR